MLPCPFTFDNFSDAHKHAESDITLISKCYIKNISLQNFIQFYILRYFQIWLTTSNYRCQSIGHICLPSKRNNSRFSHKGFSHYKWRVRNLTSLYYLTHTLLFNIILFIESLLFKGKNWCFSLYRMSSKSMKAISLQTPLQLLLWSLLWEWKSQLSPLL